MVRYGYNSLKNQKPQKPNENSPYVCVLNGKHKRANENWMIADDDVAEIIVISYM